MGTRAAMSPKRGEATETRPPSAQSMRPRDPSCLDAIARGEPIVSETHPTVLAEPAVLEVEQFSFWYGSSRALWDISMRIPRNIAGVRSLSVIQMRRTMPLVSDASASTTRPPAGTAMKAEPLRPAFA